jgi:hypothetical protein
MCFLERSPNHQKNDMIPGPANTLPTCLRKVEMDLEGDFLGQGTHLLAHLAGVVAFLCNGKGFQPDEASVLRIVGSDPIAVTHDWQAGRRYSRQESMRRLSQPEAPVDVEPHPLTLAPVK